MNNMLKILTTLCPLIVTILGQDAVSNSDICYEGVCIPFNYTKSERPLPKTTLEVYMYFNEIQIMEINDLKSNIKIYLYMDYAWQEPRIKGMYLDKLVETTLIQ